MKQTKRSSITATFDHLCAAITRATGHPVAFTVALLVVIVWGLTGPIFHFSDTWQLVINTGTTVVTFLMVFIIQQSQNKETIAVQLKLNELIAATGSSNRMIDIEDLTEEELEHLKEYYIGMAKKYGRQSLNKSLHSIEESLAKTKKKKEKKKS